MKFFIDAQLPFSLVYLFKEKNFEVLHTEHLPLGNKTSDSDIISYCDSNDLILITKDSDFLDSYLIRKKPRKLLVVTTGNIKNKELFSLFQQFLSKIAEEFNDSDWLELSNKGLIVHQD
ncbi:DUF5615 family PIN-like protein [Leptospira licerasiae]|uniref:DUF5615 family PIN-like protein n=1 Tax=Leptospira licerasiae TaxID=447106 RepID=UPI0002489600|nr:DUF5615 family PIN-like protein [Leptospira licerasiae]EIE03401.1 toxin-antitoxin system, toxin component, PIN family [Leptospira licerasiae serovar Varillal str. VAR 010]